ncbi:MAG: hypothetical protein ACKPKO_53635, partial [Candidatus Fonsibacter sp.]
MKTVVETAMTRMMTVVAVVVHGTLKSKVDMGGDVVRTRANEGTNQGRAKSVNQVVRVGSRARASKDEGNDE